MARMATTSYDKMRVIVVSDRSASDERVVFTEDFDSPAEDWCVPGKHTVDSDVIVDDMELPEGFPLEYGLKRVS